MVWMTTPSEVCIAPGNLGISRTTVVHRRGMETQQLRKPVTKFGGTVSAKSAENFC